MYPQRIHTDEGSVRRSRQELTSEIHIFLEEV